MVSGSKRSKDHKASRKTVGKWEAEFDTKFDCDLEGNNVIRLRCTICTRWEKRINSVKNFSLSFIRPGTPSIKKDTVKSHCSTEAHKMSKQLESKSTLGAIPYLESVIENTAIGKSFKNMCKEDVNASRILFNSAYYLAKKECPYTDFPDLLKLQEKNQTPGIKPCYRNDRAAAGFVDSIARVTKDSLKYDLGNANYFCVLSDGSTDSSVTEEELVYVLFLNHGKPEIRFLSIQPAANANAEGLQECINKAFQGIGIIQAHKRLLGLNVDGASVNMGIRNGLGARMKELSPWLQVVHCFNHRLELAIKDAFQTTTFSKIDDMLTKLYYLYQKSPKRLRELKAMAEVWEKSIPKPSKAYGTRWINHKMRAMQIVLDNYGPLMSHIESLSQTDSQAAKRAELVGFLKRWTDASIPIYMAIYLDILSPLQQLSLGLQQELHDPVKAVRRIKHFNWTMAKLRLVIDESLESPESNILTNFKKLVRNIERNENNDYIYQNIKLLRYEISYNTVSDHYAESIQSITRCVEDRFEDISRSPLFNNLVSLLDVSSWPRDNLTFGMIQIDEISTHFTELFRNNGCDQTKFHEEWGILQTYIFPMLQNNPKEYYLNIWEKIFNDENVKRECQNILHLFEILLITPFSNAKLERMFSCMLRVKNDWRNRLGAERLEALLRISEDGPSIEDFNPDDSINAWYNEKVRRLSAKPHKYPKKRKSNATGNSAINLITLSDLENSSDEEDENDL